PRPAPTTRTQSAIARELDVALPVRVGETACGALSAGTRAKFLQHGGRKAVLVAESALRHVDHGASDDLGHRVVLVENPQLPARVLEGGTHDPDRIGIERLALQVGSNRHGSPHERKRGPGRLVPLWDWSWSSYREVERTAPHTSRFDAL